MSLLEQYKDLRQGYEEDDPELLRSEGVALACQSMMDIAFCESEEWLQSKAVVEAAKKDGIKL